MKLENLIDGSLLGDASVSVRSTGHARFTEMHSIKQKDYLKWKIEIFNKNGLNGYYGEINKKSKFKTYTVTGRQCYYEVGNTSMFLPLRERWYNTGKKQVPGDLLLNPENLAVWYMDDGSYEVFTGRISLYSMGFNISSQHILQNQLAKFNIKAAISMKKEAGEKYYYIYLPASEAWKLLTLIDIYIPQSMRYKIPIGYEIYADQRRKKKTAITISTKIPVEDRRQKIKDNILEFYKIVDSPKQGFPIVKYCFWEKAIARKPIWRVFGSFEAALESCDIPSNFI